MTSPQTNNFPQKVVLISGATSGIGRETALALARAGYRVFAGDRNEYRGTATELAQEAQKKNLPLSTVFLDVTIPHSALNAVEVVLKEAGRIDVLINNAGYGLAGPLEELEIDEIIAQFNTNVFGLIRLTQAVLPAMRQQKSGTIIFISSISGQFGFPFFSAYSASKHAVEALGEALRFELKSFGIRSIILEPGMIKTSFVQKNLVIGKKCLRTDSPYTETGKAARDKYFKKDDAAPPPSIVASAVLKILSVKKPALRYQIGTDSKVMIKFKKILPSAWTEYLVMKNYEPDNLRKTR
jgi:NAD(P)-dependent dehydrogenase (short-subunit alcohol dehydrogenase family)